MIDSQDKPTSSSAGIMYGLNLTRGLYLKQSWRKKAYRLILGVTIIALTVSLSVAAVISFIILLFSWS